MDFWKDIIRLLKDIVKIDESLLEMPPRPEMGDYSLPCFSLAQHFKKSPAEIAQDLARKLPLKQPISKIEIKGPYLNFFISRERIAESVLNDIAKEKDIRKAVSEIDKSDVVKDKTVVIRIEE